MFCFSPSYTASTGKFALVTHTGLWVLRCLTTDPVRSLSRGPGDAGPAESRQKFVYQNWANKIFLIANFVFPHDGHFGLGGGGSRGGGGTRTPLLLRCAAILLPGGENF